MYSGFISIDETYNSKIFYWLTMSSKSDSSTPLVVWLNGGPGSSSLFGLFTEMGPLRIDPNSGNFKIEKDLTWTSKANILYIDQPIGTGYSFTSNLDLIPKNEATVSAQFYRFIQKFFIAHNELISNIYESGALVEW